MKKVFLSLLLSISLCLSLTCTAFADDTEITSSGGTATVTATASLDELVFSVTVPTDIPMHISPTGECTVADEFAIVNNSNHDVFISTITCKGTATSTQGSGFHLVRTAEEAASEAQGGHWYLNIKINGYEADEHFGGNWQSVSKLDWMYNDHGNTDTSIEIMRPIIAPGESYSLTFECTAEKGIFGSTAGETVKPFTCVVTVESYTGQFD